MKNNKIYSTIFAVFCTIAIFAQTPQNITYQAVVRTADGAIIEDTQIGVKISILLGTATGSSVCIEEFTPTTNGNGLVTLSIGSENPTDFSAIDWGANDYFVKVEVDPAGGTIYTEMGTSQLLSVPYALHAKTAETIGNEIHVHEGKVGIGIETPTQLMTLHSGNANSYSVHQNSNSGNTVTDGMLTGLNSSGRGYVWNYEDDDLYVGTNNAVQMTVKANGNIGIGTTTPSAKLDVVGDVQFGTNGVIFSEMREISGTTHATNINTIISLPSGYNENNTRVLSAQVQYVGDRWVCMGYTTGTAGHRNVQVLINGENIYLYVPDHTSYKGKAYRIILMRVD